MVKEELDITMKCIKYMLLFLTAIFVLTSALFISVGTTIYAVYHDISFALDAHFHSPAILVIVIGVFMLFVSLFGCIGALRESTCLVNIFAVVLSLVLVLEVAAAIAAYSLRGQIEEMLDDRLRDTMPAYYQDPLIGDYFDFMQERMNCCGIDSYMDWGDVPPSEDHHGIIISNITVPYSCCAVSAIPETGDSQVPECTKLYANGCLPRMFFLIYRSAGLLGFAAMTIAFIQVIGIAFSLSLARAIRQAKTKRERRRWEIYEAFINENTSPPVADQIKPRVFVPFQGQATA